MKKMLRSASLLFAVALFAIPSTLFAQTQSAGNSENDIATDIVKVPIEKAIGLPMSPTSAISMSVEKVTGKQIPLSPDAVAEVVTKAVAQAAGVSGGDAAALASGVGAFIVASEPASIATDEEEGSPGTMEQQATAAAQKLKAEAADWSAASTQALQNLQQQDSPDPAIVNAFQQMQRAADDTVATTPDEAAIRSAIEGTLNPQTQNVPSPTVQQTDDGQDDQDVEADDTNNDGNDTDADMDNDTDSDTVQYPSAVQQYQRALQNLTQATMQHAWQNIPSPVQVQQSRSPQIRNGYSSDCPSGAEGCH